MQIAACPLLAISRAMIRSAAAAACAAGSAATTTWILPDRAGFAVMSFAHLPPVSAVAGQQGFRFLGSFAAGAVGLEPLGTGLFPGIEERLHRLPSRLDAVGALEQDVITDHTVVNQGFVAGRGLDLEIILVAKLHLDAVDRDGW